MNYQIIHIIGNSYMGMCQHTPGYALLNVTIHCVRGLRCRLILYYSGPSSRVYVSTAKYTWEEHIAIGPQPGLSNRNGKKDQRTFVS